MSTLQQAYPQALSRSLLGHTLEVGQGSPEPNVRKCKRNRQWYHRWQLQPACNHRCHRSLTCTGQTRKPFAHSAKRSISSLLICVSTALDLWFSVASRHPSTAARFAADLRAQTAPSSRADGDQSASSTGNLCCRSVYISDTKPCF